MSASAISKRDIINTVIDFAPLSLQESWDNSGVQVGDMDSPCTGVMLCVDCTPDVLDEAIARGCNLVVSHHPLLFRGLKQICPGRSLVEDSVIKAISNGISIFASHTALDSAIDGISWQMARMLGAKPTEVLSPGATAETGLGVIAEFPEKITASEFIAKIKNAFGSPIVRCSEMPRHGIKRIGICGGSGGEFIPAAIAAGCDAYLTSDTRYHDFVDYGKRIFLTDIGHFESEACAKQIFYNVISKFFPNFAIYNSESERNSIKYL